MEEFLAKIRQFFQIRIKIPAPRSALLGLLPLFAMLLIWFFMTRGKTAVVTLPDGKLDAGEPIPAAGRRVPERTYLKISGAKVRTDKDSGDRVLTVGSVEFPLGDLDAQSTDDGVNIRLKEGSFIERKTIMGNKVPNMAEKPLETGQSQGTPNLGPTASASDQRAPVIGRGGLVIPPPITVPDGTEMVLLKFSFEQIQTRMFNPTILPSPGDVVRGFHSLWYERELMKNVGISFERVAKGFLVAFLVAFPLGILMGTFSHIKAMFSPLMIFSGYLPIPTLVPLSMALFGMTETQKVMFLALGFGIYLLPMFVRAIEEVDNVYLQTAYTLGASRFQVMTHILLGIAWPNIFDAMRQGFGVGWGYIILAEMVDMGCGGIGAAIIVSQRRAMTAHVYLILVIIVVLAFITDKLWETAGEYFFPYRRLRR